MQNKILIFLATLNEKDNIELIVKQILELSENYDVLVIDDNSNDGTKLKLEEMSSKQSRLNVMNRPGKLGLGSAHKAAMIYSWKKRYQKLITMDADFSHSPDSIPQIVSELDSTSFVIGSRYMPGGKSDYTGFRKWVSIFANYVARFMLGIDLHECTTSFRGFDVSIFEFLNLSEINSNGYSFFLECVFRVTQLGISTKEVPIHFKDRFGGTSKIPKTEIIRSLYKLMNLWLSRFIKRRDERTNPVELNNECYFCGSSCLVESIHEERYSDKFDVEAYKCTSTKHNSKPQVVKCLKCDLSFVPLSSHPVNLEELYSNVEDQTYLKNKDAKYKTFKKSLSSFSHYLPDHGKLLEIGSYCGFFLDVFRKKYPDWKTTGVEPSKWASEYARRVYALDVKTGTLQTNSKELSENYDLVTAWDVMEHVNDPVHFINEVRSKLKSGGYFCFSTLDINNWFPRILGKRWPWLMDMHLFYFNVISMEQMLKQNGFQLIHVTDYVHYTSIDYLMQKIGSLLPLSFLPNRIFKEKSKVNDAMLAVSFGDIKLFVAKKIE